MGRDILLVHRSTQCSIFIGFICGQIYHIYAFMGQEDIRRLDQATVTAPGEKFAEFCGSEARACG
jgi:hypothetical protein